MRTVLSIMLAAGLGLASAPVPAAQQPMGAGAATSAVQIAKIRQEHFKDLGRVAKSMRAELTRNRPDQAVVQTDALEIERLARELPHWFPAGSGPAAGVKTDAKSDVWSNPTGFNRASQNLIVRAQSLAALAKGGKTDALLVQARGLAESCADCHHQFRTKDD